MAQVSYGTITITDTNDIESIYMVYRGAESDTTPPTLDWNSISNNQWKTDITQITGTYIWQVTVITKSGVTIDSSNWTQFYGDPICITGPQGIQGLQGGTGPTGKGVKSVVTYYYLSTSSSSVTGGSWSTTPQDYPSTGTKYYWTKTITTYTDDTTYESTAVYNKALTNSVKDARDANSTAQTANTTAQNANNKADEAWNKADNAETIAGNASTAISDLNQYFWRKKTASTNVPAGSYVTNIPGTTYEANPANGGFNSLVQSSGIFLRNGITTLSSWTGDTLTFNKPGTSNVLLQLSSSNGLSMFKGTNSDNTALMNLNNNALNFYGSSSSTPDATLNSNGLKLAKGGIQAGTYSSSATDANQNFVYLSSDNYGSSVSINGVSKSDWRQIIGNKFGVDKAGNLYASNVEISGKITATSLTIGSGASISGLNASSIGGMDAYALQSSLDTEVAQRKAVYAVSTTGATTSAKTTESNTPAGFVLYNGANVTVKFNNANSTITPTLNVNGTGAKTIKSYTGAALTAAEYTWPAGAAITFTYDGSYWRMQDSGALQAKADAAASASSASGSATAASNSASAASTSASNASSSASAASNSASTASTKASEASTSASTASTKASAASTSATNAANSASAADTSATNASNSASAAASSASDASDSADAAAGSASTASSKATAASNSATAASNSATSASNSASTASSKASEAATSASTASTKASEASTSASTASTKAGEAATSATNAANSASTASTKASEAATSATNAANSATAAAEVMGGFTILWNYSAFSTSTAGDAFICGFDSATGTKSDVNGWIKWNDIKRTITKQQVNPGTIVPYNIPIYIVCRLSSATGTTGTNYMVWYNAGWKYAACPSPTAIGGSWTWTDNRDIILGSFVETGANEALTECELFNPPWTSKQITTNTTTPTSYITDIDSNKGITVKPKDSSGNDFLQMNSTAIEFFRNSTTASAMCLTDSSFRLGLEASNHTTIDTNGLHIWAGTESTATNEIALFGTTARIGKTNNSRFLMNATSLQAYNSSNKLYFEVSSTGIKYGTDLSSSSTTTTVASTTYADGKASTAQTNAINAAQEYANDASYSVEIKVTAISYTDNTATLLAVPYFQGSTTMPSDVTLTYTWYKDSVSSSNIVGSNSNTLSVTNTTAMGLDRNYICVISK